MANTVLCFVFPSSSSCIQSKPGLPLEAGTEKIQGQRVGQCFLCHNVKFLFVQGKENVFSNSEGSTFATALILSRLS